MTSTLNLEETVEEIQACARACSHTHTCMHTLNNEGWLINMKDFSILAHVLYRGGRGEAEELFCQRQGRLGWGLGETQKRAELVIY